MPRYDFTMNFYDIMNCFDKTEAFSLRKQFKQILKQGLCKPCLLNYWRKIVEIFKKNRVGEGLLDDGNTKSVSFLQFRYLMT